MRRVSSALGRQSGKCGGTHPRAGLGKRSSICAIGTFADASVSVERFPVGGAGGSGVVVGSRMVSGIVTVLAKTGAMRAIGPLSGTT